ncbi:MAG: type III-B CRISPR-associated protein Cas10/Cmr2 [Candidatus Rokuibacteriota bacterium]
MTDEAVWRLKVHAFLHDRPEKALVESGHAQRGRELAERLVGGAPQGADEAIRDADRMASAADREVFLKSTPGVAWNRKPLLRHPLSGDSIDLRQWGWQGVEPQIARDDVDRAIEELRNELGGGELAPERAFCALWRLLPDRLARMASSSARMGALWDYLPAETRMPDHSIWDHQRLVSALAPILWRKQDPTLLLVAFGPVQGFIGTARRTADLWAGSFILSWLASRAIVPLVEACGPDAVLFPSLWAQPLLDRWFQEGPFYLTLSDAPAIGGFAPLPNRFLALVAHEDAKDIAERCLSALHSEWNRLGEKAAEAFAGFAGTSRETIDRFFARQLPAHLESYWAAWPWPSDQDRCRDLLCQRLDDGVPSLETIDLGTIGRHQPNAGALYGAVYRAVDLTLGGVKASRLFGSVEEPGLKCSLCGVREVVHPHESPSVSECRGWWRQLSEGRQRLARKGEALCAVCLTKRLADEVFSEKLGLRRGVPSTSEIAAAPFKLAVLKSLSQLRSSVSLLVDAASTEGLLDAWTVDSVWRATSQVDREDNELARAFARIDGECFWSETEEGGIDERRISPKAGKAARALVTAADALEIPPPFPYLAVLRLDGDDMGRWLGGERSVTVAETLHRDTESWLRERLASDHRLWGEQRRMTPATHAAISRACGRFALDVVPVLARERLAHLIYAGGDDVLALASLDDALDLAREIRLAFGGHMEMQDGKPMVGFKRGHGFYRVDGSVVQTLGRRAGLSGALVVFHHKYPLQAATEESRGAEEWAKALKGAEEFAAKDALAIALIRRGGQQTRCRLRWTDCATTTGKVQDAERIADAVKDLSEVSGRVRSRLLSPRFFGMLNGLLRGLDDRDLPHGALDLLVKQSVDRHWDDHSAAQADDSGAQSGDAKREVCRAISRLRRQAPSVDEWLSALEVAVFLARGGR